MPKLPVGPFGVPASAIVCVVGRGVAGRKEGQGRRGADNSCSFRWERVFCVVFLADWFLCADMDLSAK